MKSARIFPAALFLLGTIVASGTALAADGSFCHMKFPAIQEETLSWNNPVLKSQDTGDFIDYYGPCNASPTGQDQVRAQKLDLRQLHNDND